MHSIVFERFGDPAEVLTLAKRERPAPGPGQALLRMILSPIHNHDLMTVAGTYGIKPRYRRSAVRRRSAWWKNSAPGSRTSKSGSA